MTTQPLILWFENASREHVSLAGGKGANLGEIYRRVASLNVRATNGFIVTTAAWHAFLDANAGLREKIVAHLSHIDFEKPETLQTYSSYIWNDLANGAVPPEVVRAIEEAYDALGAFYNLPYVDVAVRSSAAQEDSHSASFAGQHKTYLNIRGKHSVIEHVHQCFASFFTERAISYRHEKNLLAFPDDGIAVLVQKMVRSDKAASGVAFSHEPLTQAPYLVSIQGAWGLGEAIVSGSMTPDSFTVMKSPQAGKCLVIQDKTLGSKLRKIVYDYRDRGSVRELPTSDNERSSFCLSDDEVRDLASAIIAIERYYGYPVDVEWAKDGDGAEIGTGKLFIVQVRPATSLRDPLRIESVRVARGHQPSVLLSAMSASPGAAAGKAHFIESPHELHVFKRGGVLLARKTDPDWLPAMRIASAVVTDEGGKTSHAAIVARELGIPCIVGAGNATRALDGRDITVDCNHGEKGLVYDGLIPLEKDDIDLRPTIEQKKKLITRVMFILGDPLSAQLFHFYPNDGIGLARLEFILENLVQIHPRIAVGEKISELSGEERRRLAALAAGYPNVREYFIEKLTDGIAHLAAAVHPSPVIVRFSDFKSNEYRGLLGGRLFEPEEENPMLGFRGASRYYDASYRNAFQLECEAVCRARNDRGFENVVVMVPFCRTVEEARLVSQEMESGGLKRGDNGLISYMMVEIPSNVLLLERFAEYFDGFSIGSNDLTQLTLGVDRDSGALARVGDERNDAVRMLIKLAIKKARALGKPIGLCGQAPSNFPEYADFLVECGITSISVMPDAIPQTIANVLKAEERVGRAKPTPREWR